MIKDHVTDGIHFLADILIYSGDAVLFVSALIKQITPELIILTFILKGFLAPIDLVVISIIFLICLPSIKERLDCVMCANNFSWLFSSMLHILFNTPEIFATMIIGLAFACLLKSLGQIFHSVGDCINSSFRSVPVVEPDEPVLTTAVVIG